MVMMVRTRFAPSPTGYLHIGGVRTALFNWLFARRHGGAFVLRIDDTDQERNVAEALEPILNGFRWLGIDWDEGPDVGGEFGPYCQSQRGERYRAAVDRLLQTGHAYHDYATPDEIQSEREAAQQAKQNLLYSRRFMATEAEDRARFEAEGRKSVVRLKMPREGFCQFDDLIRGTVRVEWALEQDHVIQRADGSCLYHLASVVDDHDMEITHVIRAEEHLSNTARQIFIAQALGYEPPIHAHLPFVAEPGSKNKLSKRKLAKYLKNPDFAKVYEHGRHIAAAIGLDVSSDTFSPVIVDFYRDVGYLPQALVNYLLLLGWSLDDRTEFMTRDEMVQSFSLDRVNKAAASFDPIKLLAFQDTYMRAVPTPEKVEMIVPFLEKVGAIASSRSTEVNATVEQILVAAGVRVKVAGDILGYMDFFTPDDALLYDEKAFDKRIRRPEDAPALLQRFREALAEVEPFTVDSLETLMQEFVAAEDIKIGQIIHAVRVAVTGKAVGFGMFETLVILGRDRSLGRIDFALTRA